MAFHVHCRVVRPQDIQPQDELFHYIGDKYPNIQSALPQSQLSQRLSHDGDRPSRTHSTSGSFMTGIIRPEPTCRTHCRPGLLSGSPTTMSGLATVTNAPVLMVTRHGLSCIQPSATSLSSVLVQQPVLKLRPPHTRHLYSSQACLQRRSSWPAHMPFPSSLKCLIINCSVFFFHRESHF
jgi:hypothetical protein